MLGETVSAVEEKKKTVHTLEICGNGDFVVEKDKIHMTEGKFKVLKYSGNKLILEGKLKGSTLSCGNNHIKLIGNGRNFMQTGNGCTTSVGRGSVVISNCCFDDYCELRQTNGTTFYNGKSYDTRNKSVSVIDNELYIDGVLANPDTAKKEEEDKSLVAEVTDYCVCLSKLDCESRTSVNLHVSALDQSASQIVMSTSGQSHIKVLDVPFKTVGNVRIIASGQSSNDFFSFTGTTGAIAGNVEIETSGQSNVEIAAKCLKEIDVSCSGQSSATLVCQEKSTRMRIDVSGQSSCRLRECIVPSGSNLSASGQSNITGSGITKALGNSRKSVSGQARISKIIGM